MTELTIARTFVVFPFAHISFDNIRVGDVLVLGHERGVGIGMMPLTAGAV